MEMMFEETLDKHFYTNDYNNRTDKGRTESVDANAVIPEDAVSYIIKKYNLKKL